MRRAPLEEPVDVLLDREIRLRDRRAADLLRERTRALLAAVVVDEHASAFGGERPRAGRADSAGCTRDTTPFP